MKRPVPVPPRHKKEVPMRVKGIRMKKKPSPVSKPPPKEPKELTKKVMKAKAKESDSDSDDEKDKVK